MYEGQFTFLYSKFKNIKVVDDKNKNIVGIKKCWKKHKYWSQMLDNYFIQPKLLRDELDSIIDKDLVSEVGAYTITQEELKQKGVTLISRYGNLFQNQTAGPTHRRASRRYYMLIKTHELNQKLLPRDLKIKSMIAKNRPMYDPVLQRVKLVGPKSYSRWIYLNENLVKQKKQKKDESNYKKYLKKRPSEMKEKYIKSGDEKALLIPELPVMYTPNGSIVCIPRSNDAPVIAICGARSMGKSFFMNRILGAMHRHENWKMNLTIMNDVLNEYRVLGYSPFDPSYYNFSDKYDHECFERNKALLSERVSALPTINFVPHSEDELPLMFPETNDKFIVLPFSHVLANLHNFFDLGKSKKYVYQIIDELKQCTTLDQVKTVIENMDLPKSSDMIRTAILANIEKLAQQQVLDISTKFPSLYTVYKQGEKIGTFNPITASVIAGLIPVLVTNNLVTRDYYSEYIRYYLDDLYKQQHECEYLRKNKKELMIVCDEVLEILKGQTKESIEKIICTGRQRRIGFLWVTQNYSKISDRIRTNTNYLFTTTNMESDVIGKDYNLSFAYKKKIKELKRFEFCALTKDKFIIYDADGRRETSQPIFGYALFPNNLHKMPKGLE